MVLDMNCGRINLFVLRISKIAQMNSHKHTLTRTHARCFLPNESRQNLLRHTENFANVQRNEKKSHHEHISTHTHRSHRHNMEKYNT